jgi:hypothetical protein
MHRYFEVSLTPYKSGDECHIIVDAPDPEHILSYFPECRVKEMDHEPLAIEVDLTLDD